MGYYKKVYRCEACNKLLSYGCVMGNHGTCPNCGATNGSTVIDCKESSVYVPGIWEKLQKWWRK